MKMKKEMLRIVSACLIFSFSGCAHELEVRNMSVYKPATVNSLNREIRIGIISANNTPEEERLTAAVINNLKRNGFKVTSPFYLDDASKNTVDFIVKLGTTSEYKGSGWNFLINWPGFLIWTPAWHGYNYRAIYGFDADITNTKTNNSLPRLSMPLDMNIRHAAMNRTWTEISWLEWSAIAFIGGIVFTRYDKSVTPILLDRVEGKVADYVSANISNALISASTM